MGITLNASLFWLWVKVVWLKLVAVFVVEVDILCQDLLRILMNCSDFIYDPAVIGAPI